MAIIERVIIINGHTWIDVTNTTCAGLIYPLRDVIKARGKVPTWNSSS